MGGYDLVLQKGTSSVEKTNNQDLVNEVQSCPETHHQLSSHVEILSTENDHEDEKTFIPLNRSEVRKLRLYERGRQDELNRAYEDKHAREVVENVVNFLFKDDEVNDESQRRTFKLPLSVSKGDQTSWSFQFNTKQDLERYDRILSYAVPNPTNFVNYILTPYTSLWADHLMPQYYQSVEKRTSGLNPNANTFKPLKNQIDFSTQGIKYFATGQVLDPAKFRQKIDSYKLMETGRTIRCSANDNLDTIYRQTASHVITSAVDLAAVMAQSTTNTSYGKVHYTGTKLRAGQKSNKFYHTKDKKYRTTKK